MRVTNLALQQQRIGEILRREEELESATNRVSSGQRIQRPSDAPDQIAQLLRAQSTVAELNRRQASVENALPFMQASESALGDISSALLSARQSALQANNGTLSPEERQTLTDQVLQIRDRVRDLANTRLDDRYLFAGTQTDGKPFSPAPPITYAGNGATLQLDLGSGAGLATNVSGASLLNQRGTTDLFQSLTSLAAAIQSGDSAGIAKGLTSLDEDRSNVTHLRADMGARIQYVQLVQQRLSDDLLTAQGEQSRLQDVDLAEAILEAKSAETAQQASLMVASQQGQSSLLDYLR
jgi:flagellar hook-associated protein 3 FlgL